MRAGTAITLASVFLLASAVGAAAAEHRVNFDSPGSVQGWRVVSGKWEADAENKIYSHTRDINDGSHAMALSPFKITNAEIEIKAAATQDNAVNRGGCFGIMVKYLDENNWLAVRYGAYGDIDYGGAYGSVDLYIKENGESRSLLTGFTWKPEIGKYYTGRIILGRDRVMVMLDGSILASFDGLPFSGREGHVGLYALSSADFDSISIHKR